MIEDSSDRVDCNNVRAPYFPKDQKKEKSSKFMKIMIMQINNNNTIVN